MSLRAFVTAVLTGLLLLSGPVALAAGPYPPPPNNGNGQVDDSRVEAGECVIFSGSGFKPGTTVTITDNGEPRGTAPVDEKGEFRKEVCFAADASPGRHVLTAVGLGTDGKALSVSATVFVTGVSQRPGTGVGPGTGSDGEPGGGTAAPQASASPPTSPSSEAPSAEPTASGAPTPVATPPRTPGESGMGLAGWLTVFSLFALLALLSAWLLLAGRRRRNEADPTAPA